MPYFAGSPDLLAEHLLQEQQLSLAVAAQLQAKIDGATDIASDVVASKPELSLNLQHEVCHQQQGVLTLDEPIGRFHHRLPNPAWADMTLRQLLSHTAGLPGYEQNTDWVGLWHSFVKQRNFSDVDTSLQLFDQAELQYQAGQDFLYSSFGTVLASSVLQHATEQPFLAYLAAQVSQPLGLTSLQAAEQPFASQVKFYQQRSDGQVKLHWPVDLSQRWAGGGLAASSVDVAGVGAAWLDPSFITTAIQQQFWTPQTLADGRVNGQNYALGWRFSEQAFLFCDKANPLTEKICYLHHGGVSSGAQSWLVVYPDHQFVLAMNTNTVKDNYCDFAAAAAALIRPFLQQTAPGLFHHRSSGITQP